jgi:hypothetical protein
VAADGTFSFSVPEPAAGIATFSAIVEDMDALVVIPPGNIVASAANVSVSTSFSVVSQAFLDAIQALEDAIDEAGQLVEGNFTPRSWHRLQLALAVALSAQEPPTTIVALQNAVQALQAAIDALVPVALVNNLQAAINHAESLNQAHFNRGSWAMLQGVLATARTYLGNGDASAEDLANITANLWGAINNLVVIGVNWVPLEAAIAQAQLVEQGSVSRSEWAALQGALAVAIDVRANVDAVQTQADTAEATLRIILDNIASATPTLPTEPTLPSMPSLPELNPPVDPTLPVDPTPEPSPAIPTPPAADAAPVVSTWDALDAAIAEAQLIDGIFGRTPWAMFQQALDGALTVRANPNASQAQIDTATSVLREAINNLLG